MTSADPKMPAWVVLLEAADERSGTPIDRASLDRLASTWAGVKPTALYSPTRYALQAHVRAPDAPRALASVIAWWQDALRATGLPAWELIRAEIMTPAELEAELRAADRGQDRTAGPATDTIGDDLLRRALHDRLTGLADRAIFLHDVGRALAGGGAALHAVVAVGVEPLGEGARYGTDRVRDELLLHVAHALTGAVRNGDTIARVGPARFAVLAPLRAQEDGDRLARRVVASARPPLLGGSAGEAVVVSVGVATMPAGGDADALVERAETAMRAARHAGGNCHRRFPVRPGGS